ncbi:MAG TPA: DUF2461 domain-containing protein [Prolixibacteraceae bacterium]|nr:DUF2461 domain-containing protein [Prolixibacteraceae bacterium]
MKQVLTFLKNIRKNNSKEWFDSHRDEYMEAHSIFTTFVEKLIAGIGEFDPSVKGLAPKDCMYRFYRDIRFSPNKMPYKTHFGAYVCPHGKKSGYSGYYFHIEPEGNGFLDGHQLDTGLYCPDPKILKSIREEIFLNGETFEKAVMEATGFVVEDSQALKKVPNGYPSDFKYAEYLKLKNPNLCKRIDNDFLLSDHLLENTVAEFKKTFSFNTILNKAIEYALD